MARGPVGRGYLRSCARTAPLHRLQVEMALRGSARGSSGVRCFLVGALRSDMSMEAPPRAEAFSPALVGAHAGLCELQLRFLFSFCLAGACPAVLAAALGDGWHVLARHSSALAAGACLCQLEEIGRAHV